MTRGTRLPYALRRSSSRGAQIAGTLFVGAILAAVAAVPLSHHDSWALTLFGGAFAFVAALVLYAAVHQTFVLRTPQTIVECDRKVFTRCKPLQLYFRQEGAASFESLRANLVGEESWFTGHRRKYRHTRQLGTFPLFDSGAFEAPYEQTVTVEVPDLPYASHAMHKTDWWLEVWGNVRGRADFQHRFPVTVA